VKTFAKETSAMAFARRECLPINVEPATEKNSEGLYVPVARLRSDQGWLHTPLLQRGLNVHQS
jgi:hypothetical protein